MDSQGLAQVGGIFALLVFVHFVADWLCQSHDEAVAKSQDNRIRARHCLVYSTLCTATIAVMTSHLEILGWSFVILFTSHYFEDTYAPVFLWMRCVRRPPGVVDLNTFKSYAHTNMGLILLIVTDQLVHLLFLIPIAVMIVAPHLSLIVGLIGMALVSLLIVIAYIGKRLAK